MIGDMVEDGKQSRKLSVGLKLSYSVGNLGFATLVSSISFFLMIFYTDSAMVAPALASTALLVGQIWDIINDPIIGWVSDRTRSRFGRRRVFLIFGALPLAITTVLLWGMPQGLSAVTAFIWIAVSYLLFDTCFTLTQVPYFSMTPELTQDYDERTSLTAYTGTAAALGFVVGSVFVGVIAQYLGTGIGYTVAGLVMGALAGGTVGFVAWRVKQPPELKMHTSKLSPFASAKEAFSNKPFVLLLCAFASARLAFTLLMTLFAYYVTYQLLQEGRITTFLSAFMLCIILFIFFWKWVSDKKGKNVAYALGLGIAAIGVLYSFWIGPGSVQLLFITVVIAGFGLSSHWVMPFAMIPDVVENDQLKTGERREGVYYGLYGLSDKIMRTLGVFIVGWVLQLSGYVPNVSQNETALLGIRLFFGPIPAFLLLLAVPLLFYYPINRKRHAELQYRLKRTNQKDDGPF